MFTFCDVLHETLKTKKQKQTLESAQYGLETLLKWEWPSNPLNFKIHDKN